MVQDSFERQPVRYEEKKIKDTLMSLDFFIGSPKDYNKKLCSDFTVEMADIFNKMVQNSFERQPVRYEEKKIEDTLMSLDFFVGSLKDYNKKLWSNFTIEMADSFRHHYSLRRSSALLEMMNSFQNS
tara:strand:- start:1547 stop:1927 length:381 start_codon:yes stop_codon:yes gene_type:complete